MRNKLTVIAVGIVIVLGGLYAFFSKPTKELAPAPQVVVRPSPSAIPEPSEEPSQEPLALKQAAFAVRTQAATQPECNANLMEISYTVLNDRYDGVWIFPPDYLPTNLPCWKDFSVYWEPVTSSRPAPSVTTLWPTISTTSQAVGFGIQPAGLFPQTQRIYFTAIQPVQIMFAVNQPSPSPTPLPYCASGTRPGTPPICKCRNGYLGNSGKCR